MSNEHLKNRAVNSEANREEAQAETSDDPMRQPYATPYLTPVGQMERVTLQDTGGIIDDGEIT